MLYASRDPDKPAFSPALPVSLPDGAARSASLVVLPSGEVIVGYEANPVGGWKHLVVASKVGAFSAFQSEIIGSTSYLERADFQLKSNSSHTFASWIDSPTLMGYAELIDGSWSRPSYEPYSGSGDVEQARLRILSRLVSH